MMRHYRFAGVEVSVEISEQRMYRDERRLGAFAVEKVENPQVYRFKLVEKLENPEGDLIAKYASYRVYQSGSRQIRYLESVQNTLEGAYIRVCSEGKEHQVQLLKEKFPEAIRTKTVLKAMDIQHLLAEAGGFILHCSYIEKNGKAILFTAPSGTGKSTQADLWHDLRNSGIINGDRAAVRITDGKILAEGIPFAGSSKYCKNRSLPIEAIVYLGQAEQTTIQELKGYQAFSKLWEGISINIWDRKDTELALNTVEKVISQVPIYHLKCTPDESAVIALEQALKERENI